MSATVKGLLLSLLSLLDFIAWIASPLGWLTVSWLSFYYVMVGADVYTPMVAIAFSGLCSLLTMLLLFDAEFDL